MNLGRLSGKAMLPGPVSGKASLGGNPSGAESSSMDAGPMILNRIKMRIAKLVVNALLGIMHGMLSHCHAVEPCRAPASVALAFQLCWHWTSH